MPNVGDDSLHLKCEGVNEHDMCDVAVMIGGQTSGYIPKNYTK